MRIGILGTGGIGGFTGAPLAKHYSDSGHEIIFICRNTYLEAIKQNGLLLESPNGDIEASPFLVSDNAQEIGILDVVITTTKSYSLVDSLKQYQNCLDDHTIIITLQNMVNAGEMLKQDFPSLSILEGCIYVASNLVKPGHVKHIGGPGKIFFGGDKPEKYGELVSTLRKGGLDVTFVENIQTTLWKKYLFVAPLATITTAYDVTFGALSQNDELMKKLKGMMEEILLLANAKGVVLSEEDIQTSLGLLEKFPYNSKSSLQLDVEKGNSETELYYLSDYVLEEGKRLSVSCPNYREIRNRIDL